MSAPYDSVVRAAPANTERTLDKKSERAERNPRRVRAPSSGMTPERDRPVGAASVRSVSSLARLN